MATQRIIAPEAADAPDEQANWSLRPQRLDEFVGQPDLIERIRITIEAVRQRGEPMEHVLLDGPPGLGKTTMAHVIAAEMGARAHVTSGPALTRPSDLVGALTRLGANDVLFIDEIHRLPAAVEEFIYPAMEDFRIDVAVDSGMHSRTISLTLKPFTLIGATTRSGLLSAPLRSRFGVSHHLKYYSASDLQLILERSARLLEIPMRDASALESVSQRSRGTPRIANRLLRRVRDYAQVRADGRIATDVVDQALALEGVDALGLDELDRAYLRTIATTYRGGPVGLEAVAATMGEDAGTLEDVVEPYLLQIGFLARTRRGRELTHDGAKHIGVEIEKERRTELFDSGD
ncbi:MAG: Holliday junction branch migration DNA helicase RuvB [Phycisphaeraceae bacterium]|nr:MAG: Holliday junction branch migration DNA helicase RuvB [Phycisphaeraceae bacterium]